MLFCFKYCVSIRGRSVAGFDDPGIATAYVKNLRKSGHKQVKLHASEYDMQFLAAAPTVKEHTVRGFALPNDPGEFDGPEVMGAS